MAVIPWVVSTVALFCVADYFLIQTAKERQANTDLLAVLGRANGERERMIEQIRLEQIRLERNEDLQARRLLADTHEFYKGLLENLNAIEIASRGEADYGC